MYKFIDIRRFSYTKSLKLLVGHTDSLFMEDFRDNSMYEFYLHGRKQFFILNRKTNASKLFRFHKEHTNLKGETIYIYKHIGNPSDGNIICHINMNKNLEN
jgi:hypothetical protein